MTKQFLTFVAFIYLCCPLYAEDIAGELEITAIAFYQAMEQENLEEMLSYVHTESNAKKSLKSGQSRTFKHHDYDYQLSNITYVGTDQDYHYQSLLVKKARLGDELSKYDNTISYILLVYKKEGDAWHIWHIWSLHWLILNDDDIPASDQYIPAPCKLCQQTSTQQLSHTLPKFILKYYQHHNAGEWQAVKASVHTNSRLFEKMAKNPAMAKPSGLPHEELAKKISPVLPQKALSDIRFIGKDKQYAYLSLHVKETLSEGLFAGLTDSVSQRLFVFSGQNGTWRIWQEEKLFFEYLPPREEREKNGN